MDSFCRVYDKYLDVPDDYSDQVILERSPSHTRWLFIFSLFRSVYYPAELEHEKPLPPSPVDYVISFNDDDLVARYAGGRNYNRINEMWNVFPLRRTAEECLFDHALWDRVYDLWTVFHDKPMLQELSEVDELVRSSLIRRFEHEASFRK